MYYIYLFRSKQDSVYGVSNAHISVQLSISLSVETQAKSYQLLLTRLSVCMDLDPGKL